MVATKRERGALDDDLDLDRFEDEDDAPEERLAGYEEFAEDDEIHSVERRRDPLRR